MGKELFGNGSRFRIPGVMLLFVPVVLLACSVAAAAANGEVPAARLERQFHDAGSAYDEGRLDEAVGLYEDLIRKGFAEKEIFFNLGNAYFRDGRVGEAVLNYRAAWFLSPLDPDIRANLSFAFQTAGIPEPVLSWSEDLLTRLSLTEWIFTALTGYWISFLLLCPAVLGVRWRGLLLRVASVCGLMALIALAGVLTWGGFRRYPEAVVTSPSSEALFAPLDDSTPHFLLPEGSVIRVREHSGEWIRVTLGSKSGWIRESSCRPVNQRLSVPP